MTWWTPHSGDAPTVIEVEDAVNAIENCAAIESVIKDRLVVQVEAGIIEVAVIGDTLCLKAVEV